MSFLGLFSSKKRKNIQQEELQSTINQNTVRKDIKKPLRLNTQSERLEYVKDNCELVIENERQIEEAKVEYQAVTSYLTDMQRIDMIPKEQRENLEDATRKIVDLVKERNKFQQKEPAISDQQYHLFESFEDQIPKEMPKMKQNEEYQEVIKKDMEHLENEKDNLTDESEEIISKQSFLKGIAVTTCIVIVILFTVFALLKSYSEADITIPFLLTVLMGMASATYIFMEASKNTRASKQIQMKQNRQILLMNKVKIKAVNNRNYLDYTYSKYMVEGYEQLKTMWGEYVRLKDETKRYQNNTELLSFYQNELIHELKTYGIADSEIWIYQPSAILDPKEMVEVRHRLNVRRQKIRERIDSNNQQREQALKEIQSIRTNYPESEEEAARLLRQYRIKEYV
ncbi:MAG TPA: hypothetical protein VN131_02010 [Mobilitalea sp.]|nr:hypothetical protein [Mobilitalea sp.]